MWGAILTENTAFNYLQGLGLYESVLFIWNSSFSQREKGLDKQLQPMLNRRICTALQMQLATDVGSNDKVMLSLIDVFEFVA